MHFYFKVARQPELSANFPKLCSNESSYEKTQQLPKCSCWLKGPEHPNFFVSLGEPGSFSNDSSYLLDLSEIHCIQLHRCTKHFATVQKETWNFFLTKFASWLTDEVVSFHNKLPMLWCRHNLFFTSFFVIYYPNRMNTLSVY